MSMREEKNKLVYYHDTCFDGAVAAWVVRQYCKERKLGYRLHSCQYDSPLHFEKGYDVVFVDYAPEELIQVEALLELGVHVTILDHHQTSLDRFRGWCPAGETRQTSIDAANWYQLTTKNLFINIDMDKAGCRLAWEYFYAGWDRVPNIILYVEDRDLWRFELPDSEAINAWIRTFRFFMDDIDQCAYQLGYEGEPGGVSLAAAAGRGVLRATERLVEIICRDVTIFKLGEDAMPTVNTPILQSECCEWLKKNHRYCQIFAAYSDRGSKRVWSLRSKGDVDVAKIAEQFGGGGHKNAAGFRSDLKWLPESIPVYVNPD